MIGYMCNVCRRQTDWVDAVIGDVGPEPLPKGWMRIEVCVGPYSYKFWHVCSEDCRATIKNPALKAGFISQVLRSSLTEPL
jgi:hypothetical protein